MDSKPEKRLCIVIINYKTASLVLDCIATLYKQLDPDSDHIVVVDNKSGKKDIELIVEGIEQSQLTSLVSIIASPANNGFSAGNNIGIKAIKAKYYLLANGDTLFRPNTIDILLQTAEQYPSAGIISPRLEWPDTEPQISCFRYHSPLSELICSASTGAITKLLKKFNVPVEISDDITMPEWTSFACVLIRREVFDKIGYMDEGYFMYYEDVDFCRSAAGAGYPIVNNPKAHVVHLRGQSSGMKKMQRQNKRLPAYYYFSRSRYFRKFYGVTGLFISNILWLIGRSISLTKEVILRRSRSVPECQFIDIWKQ